MSLFLAVLCFMPILMVRADSPGIHLPIYRRGGRLSRHEPANFTLLTLLLREAEARYVHTATRFEHNKLIRDWRTEDIAEKSLLDEAGSNGWWYTSIEVGQPAQKLETDLDMLGPDFYAVMTTSEHGSKYDTFLSTSHESSSIYLQTHCRSSSDLFSLPDSLHSATHNARLTFPICQPGKYSQHTLAKSGSILGIGPSPGPDKYASLARLPQQTSFLQQLLTNKLVEKSLISLTLLTSDTGVLSFGTTIAPLVEEIKIRLEKRFAHLDEEQTPALQAQIEEEVQGALNFAIPPGSTSEEHFKWTDIGQKAPLGYWQGLIQGVWINGIKVLRMQTVVFDINCPFILAPASIVKYLYESVPGARTVGNLLDKDESISTREESENFHAYPCLNQVDIALELANWRFPLLAGDGMRSDSVHGPSGGKFSLGKIEFGQNQSSGYCVGTIVGSDMGRKKEWLMSGMNGVWVLGEPFFRGTGVTFDLTEGKMRLGFRSY